MSGENFRVNETCVADYLSIGYFSHRLDLKHQLYLVLEPKGLINMLEKFLCRFIIF